MSSINHIIINHNHFHQEKRFLWKLVLASIPLWWVLFFLFLFCHGIFPEVSWITLTCLLNILAFRWALVVILCLQCNLWELCLPWLKAVAMHRSFHSRWISPRIRLLKLMSLNSPVLCVTVKLVRSSHLVQLYACSVETWFHRASHSHNSTVSAGPGVLDYTYNSEEHKCKKDLLIGRLKHGEDPTWKLIRPRPTKNQYMGLYYICKGELTVMHFEYCMFANST